MMTHWIESLGLSMPALDVGFRRRIRVVIMAMILLLAFGVRLVYVARAIGWQSPPQFDGIFYDLLARNLSAGSGFVLEQGATAFRPPGYPLFLAGVYALFGAVPAVSRFADVFLGVALVAVTYRVGWLVFGQWRIGALAALGVALHPVLIYLTGRILSDILAICGTMLVVWIMVADSEDQPLGRTILLSLLLGVLALIRPGTLLFLPFVILWFFLITDRKKALRASVLVSSIVFVILASWTARNYLVFGDLIPLATEGGVTFWGGNNALANGGVVEPSPTSWLEPDPPMGLQGWPGLTEKQSQDRFYLAAFRWIRTNPGSFAELLPKKLLRGWTLSFGDEAKALPVPGWVSYLYQVFPVLGLVGLLLSLHHWRRLLPIYFLLLSSTITTLIFYGSTRQSAILIPGVTILAAYALGRSSLLLRRLSASGVCQIL